MPSSAALTCASVPVTVTLAVPLLATVAPPPVVTVTTPLLAETVVCSVPLPASTSATWIRLPLAVLKVRFVSSATDCVQAFWCQAVVLSFDDAERTSTSPSLSTSATNTAAAPSAPDVIVRLVKSWDPSFSYQAMVSSRTDADRMSTSPSPSISVA